MQAWLLKSLMVPVQLFTTMPETSSSSCEATTMLIILPLYGGKVQLTSVMTSTCSCMQAHSHTHTHTHTHTCTEYTVGVFAEALQQKLMVENQSGNPDRESITLFHCSD